MATAKKSDSESTAENLDPNASNIENNASNIENSDLAASGSTPETEAEETVIASSDVVVAAPPAPAPVARYNQETGATGV